MFMYHIFVHVGYYDYIAHFKPQTIHISPRFCLSNMRCAVQNKQ